MEIAVFLQDRAFLRNLTVREPLAAWVKGRYYMFVHCIIITFIMHMYTVHVYSTGIYVSMFATQHSTAHLHHHPPPHDAFDLGHPGMSLVMGVSYPIMGSPRET